MSLGTPKGFKNLAYPAAVSQTPPSPAIQSSNSVGVETASPSPHFGHHAPWLDGPSPTVGGCMRRALASNEPFWPRWTEGRGMRSYCICVGEEERLRG